MADYRLAAPYIEMGEGGLSRAKTDTASKYPAPWTYNGYNDWHTNRGITYAAFLQGSKTLGYAHTRENFFKMPDSVWNVIFKNLYWDAIQADTIKSDALAIYAVSWLWGSGASGGRSRLRNFFKKIGYTITDSQIPGTINTAASKMGEKALLEAMLEDRKQQFIAMNQPANLKGWLRRLERYRVNLTALIEKKKA